MRAFIIFALSSGLLATQHSSGATALTNTRSTLEQWVLAEKTISEEQTEWEEEKATMLDLIQLMQAELKLLDTSITRAESKSSEADKERATLLEEQKTIQAATAKLIEQLPVYESRVAQLCERLPNPLRTKLEPYVRRFPKSENDSTQSTGAGRRMQNLIGILTEIQSFNKTVTLASELRALPNGKNIEVKVLYFGIACGYYVDASKTYAGVLLPAAGEWSAQEDASLVEPISAAVEMFEKTQAASFVSLPVTLK